MLLPVLQVTALVSWVDGSCTTYVNVSTLLYSAPSRGTEYCVKHVCVCLSVRECFPRNYAYNLHKMFVHVTEEGRILVFL